MVLEEDLEPAHVALFVPHLGAGGVAKVVVTLAAAMAERGHRVDLVLGRARGSFLEQVPSTVKIVELRHSVWAPFYIARAACKDLLSLVRFSARSSRLFETLPFLPALVRYLRQERPVAMLAAKTEANLAAIWATRLAAVPTRLVVSEHTHLPSVFARKPGWRLLAPVIRRNYLHADVQVAVSDGVADALCEWAKVPRQQIVRIYNGEVNDELLSKARAPVDHPWFQPATPPVILGVARLVQEKNLALLLRAFAAVRKKRSARLVILGEGPLREALEALAQDLGISADVDMPGFVDNPLAYMAHSAVFAFSSDYEGLGCVIIQALAAGCPVVSTDCPSGPAELLDDGAYGRLVPVGDHKALAAALVATLDESPCRERLQHRARHYSTDQMAERYLNVLLGKADRNNERPTGWSEEVEVEMRWR